MNPNLSAKKIDINGVVQGVGFRPFIFVLAQKHHLSGDISNTDDGVCIFIQGPAKAIDRFIADIEVKKPLLSSITDLNTQDAQPRATESFKILKSRTTHTRTTLISPDVAVCKDCLSELSDPGDRRYEYPFINCTNCGPRYTIIEDIPYDRPKTSMKFFNMCPVCKKEYDDPLNRRFHAQPNACPTCGPQIFLTDNTGKKIQADPKDALSQAAQYLNQGKIIGIKGLGGFHLACDAANNDSVKRLRQQKNRPHKPFALMAKNVKTLTAHVTINTDEQNLLESYHSPIVLLKKKNTDPVSNSKICIAKAVAPMNNDLGCMLPSTPLHHLLFEKGPDILVMTSGNRSGEPLSIDNDDALEAFSHVADYFLLHNRDIYFGTDDSVARILDKKIRFIRRSRGYAPLPIALDQQMPRILGCGAGLKNTICLTRNKQAFLSPHIGDLDNVKTFEYYQRNIDHLKQILDIQPTIIAHDLHPGYMSSQYAHDQDQGHDQDQDQGQTQKNIKTVAVQHHHAHAVACMAENHFDGNAIAITLDGTGFGTDGHIWGGEILVCSKKEFTRKAHLSYIPMPGGDAAVLEPWRMATSMLYQAFGDDLLNLDLPFTQEIDNKKLAFICQMMEKDLNSPLTSSAGRLFDAVASLLCIRHTISYESQAAMELEALADLKDQRTYDFHILDHTYYDLETSYEIDMIPAIGQMVEDIGDGRSEQLISARFHNTLTKAFCWVTELISKETGLTDIVLSGGVFNNKRIFTQTVNTLTSKNFTVHTHSILPTGDGSISLGQVVVAAALEEK